MNEIISFIDSQGERLFTVEHRPDGSEPTKAYLFIHPFIEEKLWSHRVYVTTARALCEKGMLVTRFDFRGYGDSEGEFLDLRLEKHYQDIDAIITNIKENHPSVTTIGLFGLRLGGTLAAMVAAMRDDIDEIILWDPVLDGGRYMQEILRSNLAAQMAVKGKVEITRDDLIEQMKSGDPINTEGYYLTYSYFQDLSNIALFSLHFSEKLKCCLLQVVKNPKQPINKQYQKFIERFSRDPLLDKAHEEPFWKEIKTFYNKAENLLTLTLNWLD
jgi:exosortase A-associated hydrolase 2